MIILQLKITELANDSDFYIRPMLKHLTLFAGVHPASGYNLSNVGLPQVLIVEILK